MKHCDKCNLDVNTTQKHCPLCFNELQLSDKETKPEILSISKEKPTSIIKNHMTMKIFLLISLSIVVICAFINYFTKGVAWSLLVSLAIFYMWILVRHTILSHRNAFEKIFFQIVGLISILLCTNYISGGGWWFLNYVMPSLFIFVLILLNMILFINKRRKFFEVSFLIIELCLLITSIVFVSTNICSFKILYWIVLLFSSISMLGIIIMDGKHLYQEIVKRIHL